MAALWHSVKTRLSEPWFRAVLYLCMAPLFPEYVLPFLFIPGLIAAIRDCKRAARPFAVGTVGWVLLAFIGYFAVSVPFAKQPMNSLSSLVLWVLMFVWYLIFTAVLTDRERVEDTALLSTLVAGVIGLIGAAQYFLRFIGKDTPLQFWRWLDDIVYARLPWNIGLDIGGVRVCSTLNNPNILAQYLVIVIPFAAYCAFHASTVRRRRVSRFCLLAAIGCLAFTFSRGAYIALVVAAVVLVVANRRHILTIIMSALSALLLIPDAVWNRVRSLGHIDVSGLERIMAWDICLEVIAQYPVFGTGCGIMYTWQVLAAAGTKAPHAHNTVLQILVEGGIVALCMLLYLAFHLLQSGFLLARRKESSQFGFAVLAFTLAFSTQAMLEYAFTFPSLMTAFALVAAMTDNATRVYLNRPVTLLTIRKKKTER